MNVSSRPTRSRRTRLGATLLLVAVTAGLGTTAASTAASADPATARASGAHLSDGLDQQIEEDQEVDLETEVVLSRGHVDLGPRFVDDELVLMVHDDTAVEGSTWRPLDKVAVQVADQALVEVPDDPAYDFLGVEPGRAVHVVPQTQNAEVTWLGWNTQDPEVMRTVDRGVTLSMADVEGPGHVVVYLQDGGFGEPDVLWDSRVAQEQPLYVDVNTHTHANWVFSEPGVYRVGVIVSAPMLDGTEAQAVGTMRFAVGDQTRPGQALAAADVLEAAPTPAPDPAVGGDQPAAAGAADGGVPPLVWLFAAGAGLAAVAVVLAVLGRRARSRALEAGR